MGRVLPLVALAATLAFASLAGAAGPGVYDAGNRAQLFLDQHLVRAAEGVSFTLHPGRKHPKNPVLRADRPWEGWYVAMYGSVLFDRDEKRFKMWYTAEARPHFGREVTCYATSGDGIRWEKPLVGTLKAKDGKPHNAVADCLLASAFKDANDPDARRRYKMVCYVYDRGFVTKTSPDGLSWKDESDGPIVPISYVEDVVTAFRDERSGQYVAFPRLMTPVRGRSRRCFYATASRDFRHWSKPELAFAPDVRDDVGTLARLEEVRPLLNYPDNRHVMRTEFYGVGAYAAESCTVAFPWVFSVSANVPRYGNQEGVSEVQLAVSRDLTHWERPFRTPCVRRGKPGEWDAGFFSTASEAPTVGDEVWLYYGATNYTHGAPTEDPREAGRLGTKYQGAVGLVTWKRDRFVSADGPAEGGALSTVPLTFTGNRLEVNAVTRPGGAVVVDLLDAGGRPLPGYPASDPVTGDDLRHRVRFGGADVGALAGRPVSLRFRLRGAELYSFAFRE